MTSTETAGRGSAGPSVANRHIRVRWCQFGCQRSRALRPSRQAGHHIPKDGVGTWSLATRRGWGCRMASEGWRGATPAHAVTRGHSCCLSRAACRPRRGTGRAMMGAACAGGVGAGAVAQSKGDRIWDPLPDRRHCAASCVWASRVRYCSYPSLPGAEAQAASRAPPRPAAPRVRVASRAEARPAVVNPVAVNPVAVNPVAARAARLRRS